MDHDASTYLGNAEYDRIRLDLECQLQRIDDGFSVEEGQQVVLERIASTPSRSHCRVQPLQFHAGVSRGELPIGFGRGLLRIARIFAYRFVRHYSLLADIPWGRCAAV